MNQKEQTKFEYTYTAPTDKEKMQIESIRKQYLPNGELSKFEKLKKLDAKVKNSATCVALIFGVIGCLIFGTGLSFVLEFDLLFWGIALSLVGGIFMALAYPFYNLSLKGGKKKYGAEILNLSQQLLDEQTEN